MPRKNREEERQARKEDHQAREDTPKNLIKDQKKSFVRSEFVSVVKCDPSKLEGTFKTHLNEA
jgi:hypothetical protein